MSFIQSLLSDEAPESFQHELPLVSPINGKVHRQDSSNDKGVALGMWGSGVRIESASSRLAAPFDGCVEDIDLASQRWFIKSKQGLKAMIQIGELSHSLCAERIVLNVKKNATFRQGDILAEFDPMFIKREFGQCMVIVTVTNIKGIKAIVVPKTGQRIDTLQPLLYVYL